MTQKPRAIFDTSAWLACFRGDIPELEAIVETHDILTPDVCLLELITAYDYTSERELRTRLRIVSILHEIIETTPEIATAASFQDHTVPLGTRLALAIADQEGLTVYCCRNSPLHTNESERSRMTRS
ncbi:MAG: PIN domain-containing protein [Planctomycetota bacterium]